MMTTIQKELKDFILLAMIVTALLLLFFRSIKVVIISMIVVQLGYLVAWCFKSFNYEITALTGLIPPLLIVIGIPNCTLLINFNRNLKVMVRKLKLLMK